MPKSREIARKMTLAVMLLWGVTAVAGEWHDETHGTCSDCHTQHNSENGQPMRTDNDPAPAPLLLRRGTTLELCLSCHDGSNAAAPDVVTPVSYVAESAGGPFANRGGVNTTIAHHLDSPTPEVPPGGTTPMVLTCTTCHDPHGNGNYRNLRPDPSGSGASVTIVARQSVTANGSNPASVYVPSNVVYKSGVSAWCRNCHGDTLHHADEATIFGAAAASYTAWTSTVLPRVPVHSPTDDAIPSADDRVMCLSCHKAHGSANNKTLHYADGATLDSTCQECHDP